MPQSRGPSWTGGVSADQCGDDAKWGCDVAGVVEGTGQVQARFGAVEGP